MRVQDAAFGRPGLAHTSVEGNGLECAGLLLKALCQGEKGT